MAPFMGLRGPSLAGAIGLVAGLTFFLFGYDQGDFAGLLTVRPFLDQFPEIDTLDNPGDSHTAVIQGITVAIWNIGCFVSAILTMILGDALGRKKTIMLGLVLLSIGEIIQASSYGLAQLLVGRFVAGFGNGFTTATVPAWQAECTKAHKRGTILMISAGACIAAGLSFSYWMAFAFAWLEPSSAAWRVPIAIQLVFCIVALVLIVFLPESPRWLILSGREDEALKVLSALNDLELEHDDIRQEFLQIKDAVIEMAKGSFGGVLSQGDYRHLHRTILAYVLQIFQQLSGINLVTQYLALIYLNQFAYTDWVARLIAACAGTEFFLASFVAVVGIDRFWGRRSLMMFGASGMSLCMIILTVMIYLDSTPSRIVGTIFLFAFCTFFAIGWQGMAWLYQVEIVPLRIRGPANALSTSGNWVMNFVVVLIAPVAFNNIGYRTYIIFAVTNAVIVPTIYFLYPETGYRSLEEIDVIFHAASLTPNPWLSVRRIAAAEPLWYGKDGEEPFNYEASDWHQRHVRFSDEVKDSDGETRTLQNSSESGSGSPDNMLSEKVVDGERSDSEPPGPLAYGQGWGANAALGEEGAPAPVIARTSRDNRPMTRESGRGW